MADSGSAERLEGLWAGDFGDEYVDRNIDAGAGARPFWAGLLDAPEASGARGGLQRRGQPALARRGSGGENVAGIDVNEKALEEMPRARPRRRRSPRVARELPFEDGAFDLAFTTGVLIHQPPDSSTRSCARSSAAPRDTCSAASTTRRSSPRSPTAGQEGALFKLDFGARYQELFPELKLIEQRLPARADGVWDDVTYWVFEKPAT